MGDLLNRKVPRFDVGRRNKKSLCMATAAFAGNFGNVLRAGFFHKRAMVLDAGTLRVMQHAEIGTNQKPVVLLNGDLKQRTAGEGKPVLFENGTVRTLATGEQMLF